jgi:hypothetical protein
MNTETNETADKRNEKDQPRERGGQTAEDRAKSFGDQSANPFDAKPSDSKRKENG